MAQDEHRMTYVHAVIRKDIPGGQIEFSVNGISTYGEERAEFKRLSSVLDDIWSDFTDAHLVSASTPDSMGGRVALDGDWYPVNRLRRSTTDDKTIFKAITGRWDKYGISVYPEVWQRSKIDPEEVTHEDKLGAVFNGRQIAVYVVKVNGQDRVTKVGYAL